MVYGAIKQNHGFIDVSSEPGQGTTFTICLPRAAGQLNEPESPMTETADTFERGHETILLVEDEPAILDMTRTILEGFGYTVMTASTPGEAVIMAEENVGEIHLLMTDVVMPEMNGRDLAKALLTRHPHLRCLFMSGYTADVIAHHGVLDEGLNFIQKPFSVNALSNKVRESLNAGRD
jgi:DNA-binding NtrC family response regulator